MLAKWIYWSVSYVRSVTVRGDVSYELRSDKHDGVEIIICYSTQGVQYLCKRRFYLNKACKVPKHTYVALFFEAQAPLLTIATFNCVDEHGGTRVE